MLVNGQPTDRVPADDRGLLYGDGLFETVAIADGRPLLWERHMERLAQGASRLGIPAPAASLLSAEADLLCRKSARAVLKIVVTRGGGSRGYAPPHRPQPTRVLSVLPWPEGYAHRAEEGVRVRFCHTRLGVNRALAGIKHLNRLEQVLGRAECGIDFDEGLMLDRSDYVIEGTMSNVFAVYRGRVATPELNTCGVEGIMRAVVLDCAQNLGHHCEVRAITRARLLEADEIFLTNSLIGIWPLAQLETRSYTVGLVTRTLQQAIRDAHAIV